MLTSLTSLHSYNFEGANCIVNEGVWKRFIISHMSIKTYFKQWGFQRDPETF